MNFLKRFSACIFIILILAGTVSKPVSVSADSIFGKSWFYSDDDTSEGGSNEELYFTDNVAGSDSVADALYDQYVWYYKFSNRVGGSNTMGHYTRKFWEGNGAGYVSTNLNFFNTFLLNLHTNSEIYEVKVNGTKYKRIDTTSSFIYYEAEKGTLVRDSVLEELRPNKNIRKVQPFTQEIYESYYNMHSTANSMMGHAEKYFEYVKMYYPSDFWNDPLSFSKADAVKAISELIEEKTRTGFETAYKNYKRAIGANEDDEEHTSDYKWADANTKIKNGAETIYKAYLNNNYLLVGEYYKKGDDWTHVGYVDESRDQSISERYQRWINDVFGSIMTTKDDMLKFSSMVYSSMLGTLASASGLNVYTKEESEAGSIEQSLSEFVVSIASQIGGKLRGNGITLNTVVFGRVQTPESLATPINYYSFELQKNNSYGLIGSYMFSILRSLLVMGIFIYAMIIAVKASFVISARSWMRIKDDAAYILGAIALLLLMPHIVDGMLYLRDWILKSVAESFGDGVASIQAQALVDAQSGKFLNAAEYFGMIILALYFAFAYISTACSMMIMFGMFPVFLLVGFGDKKIVGEWFKFTLSVAITPVIDALLLFVPHIAETTSMPPLVKVLLCMSIVPSRGVIRQMLGFNKSVGAEMLGIGAMLAAGRAIGGVANTAKNLVTGTVAGAAGVIGDAKAAKAYGAMAKEDNKLVETAQRDMETERAKFDGSVAWTNNDAVKDNEFRGSVMPNGEDQDYFGQGTDGHGNIESLSDGLDRSTAGMLKPVKSSTGYGSGSIVSSAERASRQRIMAKAATLGNFDSRYGNELSNEQMAAMYRKRAVVGAAKTAGTIYGTAKGAVYGGALGLAGGMMLGPTATVSAAGMGASMGGEFFGATMGTAGSLGANGLYSAINWEAKIEGENAQFTADTVRRREYLAQNENLAYEMYTGDAQADVAALDNEDFLAAQQARWDACETDEQKLQELRYQRGILARTEVNTLTGEKADEGQLIAVGKSKFHRNFAAYQDAYGSVIGHDEDTFSYGYYSQGNVKNWEDKMLSSNDPKESSDMLKDHVNSNRMGMLILSAQEGNGEYSGTGTVHYANAKYATQKVIARNSGALSAGAPTYVSNSFEAGRVWNRFADATYVPKAEAKPKATEEEPPEEEPPEDLPVQTPITEGHGMIPKGDEDGEDT